VTDDERGSQHREATAEDRRGVAELLDRLAVEASPTRSTKHHKADAADIDLSPATPARRTRWRRDSGDRRAVVGLTDRERVGLHRGPAQARGGLGNQRSARVLVDGEPKGSVGRSAAGAGCRGELCLLPPMPSATRQSQFEAVAHTAARPDFRRGLPLLRVLGRRGAGSLTLRTPAGKAVWLALTPSARDRIVPPSFFWIFRGVRPVVAGPS
jgi:hypothetical protein